MSIPAILAVFGIVLAAILIQLTIMFAGGIAILYITKGIGWVGRKLKGVINELF